MIVIAAFRPDRLYWSAAAMVAISLVILALPAFVPGGVPAMVAGEAGFGHRSWPVAAVAALVIIPWMTARIIKASRHRGPAVYVEADEIRAFGLKASVPVSSVDHLLLKFPGEWSIAQEMPLVVLTDGRRLRIPPDVLASPEDMMRELARVTGLTLKQDPPAPSENDPGPLLD